ncbi:MAG TPA: TIM barrel protein [Phnomibacter sp.]|nr:TIM barrel protein [Phnomibacter sp.]
MERRRFLQQSGLASLATLAGTAITAKNREDAPENNQPFNLDYAFHDGMFAQHAGNSFLDQIKFAYDQGFRSIEDNGLMARPVDEQQKIGDLLAKLNMRMGVFVITSDSWHWKTSLATGKQEWIDKMKKDCHTALEVAKRVNAKWATVVPGNYERSLPIGLQTGNVIDALKIGAAILETQGLTMVLEPLSDNPDLFLRHSDQTYEICRAVNSPSCKILFDIYHMQRNEGNLIANIDKCWSEIGYIQIGDNPGRREPGTGEINYRNLFGHLYKKGYKGIMGMEHGIAGKGKEGELALIKAYREADAFAK